MFLVPAFSGCIGQEETEDIILASIFPQTGAIADIGIRCDQGVKTAVKQINEDGGIESLGGAKIKIVSTDSTSDPEKAVSEAERLITTEEPNAVIGCYASSLSYAVSQVTETHQIPFFTWSSAPEITGRGFKYIFRFGPNNIQYGASCAYFIRDIGEMNNDPITRVAVLHDKSIYSETLAEGVGGVKDEAGFTEYKVWIHDLGMTDFSPIVTEMKAWNPEALIFMSYTADAIILTRTMHELDFNAKIFMSTTGAGSIQYTDALASDADYVYSIAFWSVKNRAWNPEGMDRLWEDFQADWDSPPDDYGGEYWMGTWVIKEVLEKAGSLDKDEVRQAAIDIKVNPELGSGMASVGQPNGKIDWDEAGNNIVALAQVSQIQNGQLELIWPWAIKSSDPIFPRPDWDDYGAAAAFNKAGASLTKDPELAKLAFVPDVSFECLDILAKFK